MSGVEKEIRGWMITKRGGRFGVRVFVPLMLATTAGPLTGQAVAIDETRALRSDASVEIDVVSHSLTIEGWDRDEIQIAGEYDSRFESIEMEGGEASFEFRIRQDENSDGDRRGSSQIRIRLPRGARIEAGTISGSLEAEGLNGSFEGGSVSGEVDVQGDLDSAQLESVSGSVTYRGDATSVSLESVSGGVDYQGESRSVELTSVSGSVQMAGSAETIEASSVSGSVDISSAIPVRSLEMESVSGRVRYEGALVSGGAIEAESHSGSVDLVLGGAVDARFELSSFSGNVDADLPGAGEVRGGYTNEPGRSLSFTTGSGSGRVRASSFSGSVRIRSGR